jgi:MoaA/NifB/PqqE/SkfB family radical SAM enzyme
MLAGLTLARSRVRLARRGSLTGQDVAAVSADGDVSPCVFTRWLTAGNVRHTPLADILTSPQMTAALATIPPREHVCDPNLECRPGFPPSSCDPRT